MIATLMPMPKIQFWGVTGSFLGLPLAGGFIYTCIAGGTIGQLQASYTDSGALTANPNPVVLDSNGMANIWLVGYYKIYVYDQNNVLQYSVDNVSSSGASATTLAQWLPQTLTLAYISGTQFSALGSLATTFPLGTRIAATVSVGTIYGTVTAVSVGGIPIITTVTVLWDSGSLDSGLSSVSTGIISVTSGALPILPVVQKTANYTLLITDVSQIFEMNSASNLAFTLPLANAVPSGAFYRLKNIGAGSTMLVGTVDGTANRTLLQYDEVNVYSDGSNWYGKSIQNIFPANNTWTGQNNFSGNTTVLQKNANAVIALPSNVAFLTTGTNAVYTTPANSSFLHVRMVGGGGGGASGSGAGGNVGGATLFAASNANGGNGGVSAGAGGAGGGYTTNTVAANYAWGSNGQTGGSYMSTFGGYGGGTVLGPTVPSAASGAGLRGYLGAGGAGGGSTNAGGGGGGAAYVELWILNPAANYTYSVGNGGGGGASGVAGGAGGNGVIIVEAFG